MRWYIVASQKEAKIFSKSKDSEDLDLQRLIPNPLAGEKKKALIKKEAGRGVKSIGRIASIGYAKTKRSDPHDEAVNQFVRELVGYITAEKHKHSFTSLTVVAEPRLLGKLRSEMHDDLKVLVTEWIGKDLQKTKYKQLSEMLLTKPPPSSQPLL